MAIIWLVSHKLSQLLALWYCCPAIKVHIDCLETHNVYLVTDTVLIPFAEDRFVLTDIRRSMKVLTAFQDCGPCRKTEFGKVTYGRSRFPVFLLISFLFRKLRSGWIQTFISPTNSISQQALKNNRWMQNKTKSLNSHILSYKESFGDGVVGTSRSTIFLE